MKRSIINVMLASVMILFFIVTTPHVVECKSVSVGLGKGAAKITFLKGSAFLVKKDLQKIRPLAKGDLLKKGNRVKTEKAARLELKLPDGSYIRFDENTSFKLDALKFNKQKKQRNVRVNMALGKTWAKVSKFRKGKGRFAITTKTAVAGVRGTVYRMNVYADNSAVVKVYWGEILVEKRKALEEGSPIPKQFDKPKKVLGPQPIAGPRPVSLKEWTYIVKALQQINIRSDGTATKPFRFDIAADLNDWVRWNQERDQALGDEAKEE